MDVHLPIDLVDEPIALRAYDVDLVTEARQRLGDVARVDAYAVPNNRRVLLTEKHDAQPIR